MGIHVQASLGPRETEIPNPTLLARRLTEVDGPERVDRALEAFRQLHVVLAEQARRDELVYRFTPVPEPKRAAWRMADLYVRGALWDIYSLNEIRKLRFLASSGDPLAICMGPIAVEARGGWALAPSAGIGCGCVFPPKGNRSAGFPDWCPLCHKARRADRAAISLVRWKNVHDAYSRVGAEGYARELWRLVRLHERRSPIF